MTTLDAVIVGAGQAGLGVSYFLKQQGLDHVVFEKGRIGETWLSQRWDSFRLNTPNFMNSLPGLPTGADQPGAFLGPYELVSYFQRYVNRFQLPVRTSTRVVSVERVKDQDLFLTKTRTAGGVDEAVFSRAVVVASGILNVPKIPPLQSRLPPEITQLHASAYRSPGALPAGAVVIVGGGQSGCQIAEDLLSAGRKVYLCTSRVGRAPRRYRGRDILEWWIDMKFIDAPYESLPDKSISRVSQPQVSGLGPRGHSVSLQFLSRRGAVILGRLVGVESGELGLGDDAAANVRFADAFSQKLKDDVDAWLAREGITPPPLEDDPADVPDPEAACASPLRRLDLAETKVGTVIWTCGFGGDFNWLHLPVLDADGLPIHHGGISPERGLTFVGFPWLIRRKSGIIYGIEQDAGIIAEEIIKQLA
jgi:putative flavoprotein involved in K+ transport